MPDPDAYLFDFCAPRLLPKLPAPLNMDDYQI